MDKQKFHLSNTSVELDCNGNVIMKLFGNIIARLEKYNNKIYFTMAGYNTRTTKDRLKSLGITIIQKNFTPYYNGREISSYEWYSKE